MTARAALAQSLAQVRASLEGGRTRDPHTRIRTRAEAYRFIERTLERFDYPRQGKARKGILRYLLGEVTGLSRAQITRLLSQHRTTGRLRDHRGAPRRPFPSRYTAADIELLAELDALHGELPGPLARALCTRACRLFGDRRFERLAGVSNGHIYNLRRSTTYRRRRDTVPSACGLVPRIGERRRLQRFSRPGHMRVVSVFSRAVVGAGSLYALHLQDEVTQFQFVGCAERLRAPSLAPVVDDARRALPFPLLDFHAARGSQRTTREVADLLAALHAEHPEPGEQPEPAGDLVAARPEGAGPAPGLPPPPPPRPPGAGRATGAGRRPRSGSPEGRGPDRVPRHPLHTRRLRRPVRNVQPAGARTVSELPPAPLFPARIVRRDRPPQALPPAGRPDAVREVPFIARGGPVPEAGRHLRATRRGGHGHERQRRCARPQRGRRPAVRVGGGRTTAPGRGRRRRSPPRRGPPPRPCDGSSVRFRATRRRGGPRRPRPA